MATSKLPRDPLQPPPARPQPQHLRHIVRRLHHLPPWIFPRRGFRDSLLVHSLSPQLAKEGAIPRGAEGAVFHGARHLAPGPLPTLGTTPLIPRSFMPRGRRPRLSDGCDHASVRRGLLPLGGLPPQEGALAPLRRGFFVASSRGAANEGLRRPCCQMYSCCR